MSVHEFISNENGALPFPMSISTSPSKENPFPFYYKGGKMWVKISESFGEFNISEL